MEIENCFMFFMSSWWKKANKLFFISMLFMVCAASKAQQSPVAVKDSNAIKELFFAGLKEKMNENYTNASSSFSKILLIDPSNDAAHFELANLQLRQNKILDAEVSIKKALVGKPQNIWYLKLLSEIYKRNGNMDALVQTFDKLIALDPDTESFYFDRANALFISGKVDESKKAYDFLEQKFGVSKASAAAKKRFKTSDTNGNELQKAITDSPNDVKNYLELSGVLLEKNQNEEALNILLKAKAIDADNYEVNLDKKNLKVAAKSSVANALANDKSLDIEQLLIGANAFGTLIANEGFNAVPSKQDKAPLEEDKYFNGGYNTRRYTSIQYPNVFGWQIESNYKGVRDAEGRPAFAKAFTEVMGNYFKTYLKIKL